MSGSIDPLAIDRLVGRHPLALLVSQAARGPRVTAVPLILNRRGTQAALVGHLARANPQVAALRSNPRATAIFLGPNHYLSPSWLDDRTQAPSWNYALVHMEIDVAFDDADQATRAAVIQLTEHMETDRGWRVAEMGPRFERLLPRIIAFRATVIETHARFKLGQTDRDDVFQQSLAALARQGASDLVEAMRAAHPARSFMPEPQDHAVA